MRYRRILKKIEQADRFDLKALAKSENLSPSMMEAILQELLRLEYLSVEKNAFCTSGCAGCPIKGSSCSGARGDSDGSPSSAAQTLLWSITEKGKKFLDPPEETG